MSKSSRRRLKRNRRRINKDKEIAKATRRRTQKRQRAKAKRDIPRQIVATDTIMLTTFPQQEERVMNRLGDLDIPAHDVTEVREVTRRGKPYELKRRPIPRGLFAKVPSDVDPHDLRDGSRMAAEEFEVVVVEGRRYELRKEPERGVKGVYGPLMVAGRIAHFSAVEVQRFADEVRSRSIHEAGEGAQPGDTVWVPSGLYGPGRYKVHAVLEDGALLVWMTILGKDVLREIAPEDLREAA